jgi:hypothetical protein
MGFSQGTSDAGKIVPRTGGINGEGEAADRFLSYIYLGR